MDIRMIRTWAEIDLDALEHNYRSLRSSLPENCGFVGLVKANAYGHGAVPVAKKLESLGAELLAVACGSEGEELRQAGITTPILCLGNTLPCCAHLLLEHNITQAVGDLDTARALSQAAVQENKNLNIHIKLDTGMSRLGFFWNPNGDNAALLNELAEVFSLPNLTVQGMFTHFADADSNEEYSMAQLTRFLDARDALAERGLDPGLLHCGASAATLNFPCTHMDLVRPGIALYGYYPAPEMQGLLEDGLRPVMTLKSRICAVRSLPAGTCVSYGCTATLTRDSRLAVLPIGYGDGFPRSLSNQMKVRIHDTLCPIVGRVCMDMCMVDVTDLPQTEAGDVATIYGGGLTQQAAELDHTIVYELLCDVTPRVPRIYIQQGAPLPG